MSSESTGILLVFFEVIQSIVPLIIFFTLFQILFLKLPSTQLIKLYTGLVLTALGMILFLHGVNNGFLPAGTDIGEYFGESGKSLLIPLGFILGLLATLAEPSVRVLCYQVEESSNGSIRADLMLYLLSFAVATLAAITMAKIVYRIPFIYIIIPSYLFVLVLLLFCDKDFIGIAFDAGGAVTGPMAVSFLMSIAVGVATAYEGADPVADGFGLIAMIALAPIIFVMLLGVYMKFIGGKNNVR
ncbi:DUF1538 domain-containing protein [Methanosarcina mazei]|jgi:hypothetical protein|uniref:DUF1538 domain-containing protein n=5 Tax=Methanosarcina mazei TaxID=2209 RepID=A0A0F8EJA3_METMZ|nr:DUF1538 domain-containing protein [Methanosarcina mazei]AGF96354.1 hypothetical protein MmTuc01_0954 [Methanosarcina mazei Tuc01]AKB39387.1 hypothetical protein MSMAW_0396 [Methanosarcina mazei WWM610]AKB60359.1 hypothetical protein MSMAP_0374 [Methanosarcina mazei SarPi]AKB70284.1 hypothetical protein MSMAC_0394 [Methanosarcina mazei C16]KKF99801.1 hypothetical protein DU47_07990 [Methanosarcina mazei]